MRTGKRADPVQIQHISGEVGGMGTNDGAGLGFQQPFKGIIIHAATFVGSDHRKRDDAFVLQSIQRTQHRIVLQIGGDYVISTGKQAVQRNVQRLRCIGCKHHMIRPAAPKKGGNFAPVWANP